MLKKHLPVIFILLLALSLRAYRLTDIPPGLTHDEANHGREAVEILDGILRYYFPLNYGSEPVYSYTVAGLMALIGEGILALRLVNVIFGLAVIGATYIWVKLAFDRRTGLVTALLMTISFWPLASSREALRAGMLPFFMVLAVWFFWQIIYADQTAREAETEQPATTGSRRRVILLILGFALSIVMMLHIYLAARIAWLLFPAFLLYLAAVHRASFLHSWKPVFAGLLLSGVLTIPMFVFLANNPEAQTRLSMLGSTLEQVQEGNVQPVLENAAEALLAFVWPGYGDGFLAYNIPGRPVFDVISAVFFVIGIVVCLWRWKRPPYAFLLLWFVIGISPSLITGATANTTRNLAALPAVFILPVIGFTTAADLLAKRSNISNRAIVVTGAALWLLVAGLITTRDYFIIWGQSPAVRGAYQHTLVKELDYLTDAEPDPGPVIISTVYPGPAHDASIALVLAGSWAQQMRWVDARYALLLPKSENTIAMIPDSTPQHPAFEELLQPLDRINLGAKELDPGFTLYAVDGVEIQTGAQMLPLANFGGAVQLMQAQWLSPQVTGGETAELLTVWQVLDPALAGPVHLPTLTTDVAFFTHVLDHDNNIIAQRDALDAPSWSWQRGDTILQIHPLNIPADIQPGDYTAVVGMYDKLTGQRLPIINDSHKSMDTVIEVPELQVAQS